ncbi:MAG: dehydratase [Bacteroidetes bacterium QS_8_64_10]|jgi:acyl dehydratase|nr:MAG: dehydratase [Bacteroidetes bacterium QS_8_64_10]
MSDLTYETIQVGDSHSITRVLTEEDVRTFAEITGDDNPIHLDEEYAQNTRFGKPVVHGVLLLGIISKMLGHDFPGAGSIAVKLSCRFLRPVPVGAEIRVEVKITEKMPEKEQVKGRVYIYHDEGMAMGGEATLIPPGAQE